MHDNDRLLGVLALGTLRSGRPLLLLRLLVILVAGVELAERLCVLWILSHKHLLYKSALEGNDLYLLRALLLALRCLLFIRLTPDEGLRAIPRGHRHRRDSMSTAHRKLVIIINRLLWHCVVLLCICISLLPTPSGSGTSPVAGRV